MEARFPPCLAIREVWRDADPATAANAHPFYAVSQAGDRLAFAELYGALDTSLQTVAAMQVKIMPNSHDVTSVGIRTAPHRQVLKLDP